MITLLSDFGLEDASAAIAKGILMQYVSLQPIVDVSHEVLPFNIPHAAYVFSSAHKYFPAGAVHVLLIDVFSEKINRLILSRLQNQYFLSADNGIVPMIIDGMPDDCRLCAEMKPGDSFNDWLHKAGGAISSLQMQNGRPADFQV